MNDPKNTPSFQSPAKQRDFCVGDSECPPIKLTARERREKFYLPVRDMRENGWPRLQDIAQRFGLPMATVADWCRDLIPPVALRAPQSRNSTKSNRSKREEWAPKVRNLASTTSKTWTQISLDTGIPYQTVRDWCKGIKRPYARASVNAKGLESLNTKLRRNGFTAEERAVELNKAREDMRRAGNWKAAA